MQENANKAAGRPARLKRVVGSLLLTIALLEAGSRVILGNLGETKLLYFWPPDGRPLGLRPGVTTHYNGYFLKIPPVILRVNEHGFRGTPRPPENPGAARRIALLGDSYTYGVGVGEANTAAVLLEKRLASSDAGAQVLNFGLPGANLDELVSQYRLFAARWRPDTLVLLLSDNDLDRAMFEKDDPVDPNVVTAIFRNVYSARVLLVAGFITGMVVKSAFKQSHVAPAVVAEKLRRLRAGVCNLGAVASEYGAAFAFVLLGNPIPEAPNEVVLTAAKNCGASVFDLSDLLKNDDLKIPREGHLNLLGNALLASELVRIVGNERR